MEELFNWYPVSNGDIIDDTQAGETLVFRELDGKPAEAEAYIGTIIRSDLMNDYEHALDGPIGYKVSMQYEPIYADGHHLTASPKREDGEFTDDEIRQMSKDRKYYYAFNEIAKAYIHNKHVRLNPIAEKWHIGHMSREDAHSCGLLCGKESFTLEEVQKMKEKMLTDRFGEVKYRQKR